MIPRSAPRGFVLSAPSSGAGKTTVTLGLLRALSRRGVSVQPFKCGPDYIDPAFHARASGRASYNLDAWAMPSDLLAALVDEASRGADLVLAEGAMGLYDGVSGQGEAGRGSSADVAAALGWPVVLVLDVRGQGETAAAIAAGLAAYRPEISMAGVILNRVASERHLDLMRPAFQRLGIPILGTLPRAPELALPERHLGLVQAAEQQNLDHMLDRLADMLAATVDLDALVASARPARRTPSDDVGGSHAAVIRPPGQRIALASDVAFSFTYPHLLTQWRAAGAEITPFSPLAGNAPDPSADAVWLPGGYPELHAGRIASSTSFLDGLRKAAQSGVSIHGECGGYMVLGDGLEDAEGHRHAMAGLLSLETSFKTRRLHLGYRRARLRSTCALGAAGSAVLGHEFHYATIRSLADEPLVEASDAAGNPVPEQGARRGAVSGTFIHAIAGKPA